jgi:hypothetical protein
MGSFFSLYTNTKVKTNLPDYSKNSTSDAYLSEPSGLLIYTQDSKLHDDIKKTSMRLFRKSKEPYLTF